MPEVLFSSMLETRNKKEYNIITCNKMAWYIRRRKDR